VASVPLCAWFSLHTSQVDRLIQTELDRKGQPGLLSFDRLDWSLFPLKLTVHGLHLRDREGQTCLQAKRVTVTPNTEESHQEARDVSFVAPKIVIEDFALNLRWNQHGKLELSEAFRTRSFDWKKTKRAPLKLRIDTPVIVLKNGDLSLDWPNLGLSFTDLNTRGTLSLIQKDLAVEIDSLTAQNSTFEIRRPSPALQKRLGPLAATFTESVGLQIPMNDIQVRQFLWDDYGFHAEMTLGTAEEKTVRVSGQIHFFRDGIHHELNGNVTLSDSWIQALSRDRMQGPLSLAFNSKGVGLTGTLGLRDIHLEKATLASTKIERLRIPTLDIDTQESALAITGTASAQRIGGQAWYATQPFADVSASLGWPGWQARSFFSEIVRSPRSLLKRFTLFGAPKANISIPSAKVATLSFQSHKWQGIALSDLSITAKLRHVEGVLKSLRSDTGQQLEASLESKMLSLALSIRHGNTRPDLLTTLYGKRPEWDEVKTERLNATVSMNASITKPLAFDVNKISTEAVQ